MKKSAQSWTNWGDRLRDHVRHRQIAWGKLASDMKLAESEIIKSQIADSASTILSNTGNFEIRAASQQKSLKSHHRRGPKPT